MVSNRPKTLNEFAQIPGVGEAKLKRYGSAFLEVLTQAQPASRTPEPDSASSDTTTETLDLFRQGLNVEAIASQRGLTTNTIWNHLSGLIAEERLLVSEVVNLPESELNAIRAALTDSQGKLKPVFEQFSGKYSYEVIRCVKAGLRQVEVGD
jgi:ATP-dependent DNA helicase RecQ